MTTQDDLDQLLWDYVFGLLEPEEARALESRITSEHDVARAYSEVRQRADLLAAAARIDIPPVTLVAPSESLATVRPSPSAAVGPQWISWFMASAALALVALLGYTWQRHDWLRDAEKITLVEKKFAADYRRVILTGPTELKPHASNNFTVQLEDLHGVAVSDQFALKLQEPDGQPTIYQGQANADGVGQVAVDGRAIASAGQISAWCLKSPAVEPAQLQILRAEPEFVTYFACNQPVYQPGDVVHFRSVTLPREVGSAEREFQLNYYALAPDGGTLATAIGLTQHGVGNGRVTLPKNAAAGRYVLQLDSPQAELPLQELTFDVAPQLPALAQAVELKAKEADVSLNFYAEGGKLVPGMNNKLFFEARDAQQQPVSVAGRIVDSREKEITTFRSSPAGRGEVEFTPQQNERYFFAHDGTAEKLAEASAPLPPVASDVTAKLATNRAVVEAGEALDLEVATTKSPSQLLVAARCNGELVGQQFVEFDSDTHSSPASQRISLAVADTAAGAVNLSLYDIDGDEPKEISQGLVYRQPAHFLKLAAERDATSNPDGSVEWLIRVRDEQDRRCSATLGVNVINETALPSGAQTPSLLAAWYSPPGLAQDSQDFLPVNRYANGSIDGASLGFLAAAQASQGDALSGGARPHPHTHSGEWDERLGDYSFGARLMNTRSAAATAPPAIADNLPAVEAAFQRAVTEWRDREQTRLRAFALVVCVGSLVWLLALALLLTLRSAGRPQLWLPALGVSAAALLIAVGWLGVRIEPSLQVAARPIHSLPGQPPVMGGFGGGGMGGEGANYDAPAVAPVDEISNMPAPVLAVPLAQPTAGPAAEQGEPATAVLDSKPVLEEFADTENEEAALRDPTSMLNFAGVKLEPTAPLYDATAAHNSPVQRLARQPAAYTTLPVHRWGEAEPAKDSTRRASANSSTLYWNPLLITNDQGEARIRFAVAPGVRYRIVIDAHGSGRMGSLVHHESAAPEIHAVPGPATSP